MKKRMLKFLALMLIVILALPILPTGYGSIASAATKPTLSMTSKTLVGEGASFTLQLKNVDMSKVKRTTWYSQNEKVAIVDAKTGYVTSVGKGKTNVKCKITYKDGSVERPACKVTVKIPATEIKINNAKDYEENNNRHIIVVGESFNFNRTLTPSNANDKTYWFVDNENYATVNSSGIVKALKPGFIRLTAVASLTKEGVETSVVNDIINVEIVDKTANVVSVILMDTTTLSVTFSSAIDASTILGSDGKLTDNVAITAKTDDKGNAANGLGQLTGTLSTDGKTLTIKSTNIFNGLYGVHFSSNIKTKEDVSLLDYYENFELYDKTAPFFKEWSVDDTGLKVTLNFSEPMDFTNLTITNVKAVNTTSTALPTTISMLGDKNSYIVSEDKKSLSIDLTTLAAVDQNKMFSISLSNIKDLAGNYPTTYPLTVYFQTDTTPKAQARLTTLVRTGYNTLTATFTRAIKTPGMILLSNGEWITGVVDTTDNKKVNYTLSTASALLSGAQKVSVGYWDSYNVSPTDTSAALLTERIVDFTVDKSVPVLIKSELTMVTEGGVDSHVITLTYNKNVTLLSPTGSFTAKLVTLNNDIYSNKLIGYTAVAKDTQVTVVLTASQFTESGYYTITIPAGFVLDNYMNLSLANTIQVKKDAGVSSALPAPKEIKQSPENASEVYVVFGNKVDETTAQSVANYSIIGTTIISAELIDNTPTGATVKLKLLTGSVSATTLYPVIISGVTGYHSSYTAMDTYQSMVLLTENKAANLVSATYSYPLTVTLTFDENIKGTASFQVIHNNVDIAATSTIIGNTIVITLKSSPTINGTMQIVPTQYNVITDMYGNTTTVLPRYIVATITQ
jgi:hypothetical protein